MTCTSAGLIDRHWRPSRQTRAAGPASDSPVCANVPRHASLGRAVHSIWPAVRGSVIHIGPADCGGHRLGREECPRYHRMRRDRSRGGCAHGSGCLLCAARAGSSRQADGRRYGLILTWSGSEAGFSSSEKRPGYPGRRAIFISGRDASGASRPFPCVPRRTSGVPPCDTAATVTRRRDMTSQAAPGT